MNTCTTCGRCLDGNRALWTTCQACQERVASLLVAIEDDWPRLSDCLEPTRGHSGPRVSGTKTPSDPIPAGRILDLIGPMGVPTRMYMRYADIALARRVRPATMPPGADNRVRLALYGLRKHLPWAVQGADLGPLVRELDAIADELRQVVGSHTPTPSVPCPAQLPDKSDCAGRMRYDEQRNTAYCRACRTELDPGEWLGYWVKVTAEATADAPV